MQVEKHSRRSYDSGGLLVIFTRIARVMPTFAFLSIVSCTVAYFIFGVHLSNLAVIAGTPCVVGFIMLRILALILPIESSEDQGKKARATFQALVVSSVASAFIAIDFLGSAVIYYILGFKHYTVGALTISEASAAIAFGLIIVAIVPMFSDIWTLVISASIKLLRTETKISNELFSIPFYRHFSR